MMIRKTRRAALMAAASLAAAGVASGALAADAVAAPTYEEAVVIEAPVMVDDLAATAEPARKGRLLALSAAAAATLALLGQVIGWKTVRRNMAAAGPQVAKVAKAAAAAPASVVRAVGSRFSAPLRALLIFASLVTTAFVGVGFYDVEWLGGLIIGAAMVLMGTGGVARTKAVLARVPGLRRRRTDAEPAAYDD